ncbi:MAG: hypothetical protein RLZZ210_804 [Pseudomonadota bacterium]|jgi:chromosome segregation ATPase
MPQQQLRTKQSRVAINGISHLNQTNSTNDANLGINPNPTKKSSNLRTSYTINEEPSKSDENSDKTTTPQEEPEIGSVEFAQMVFDSKLGDKDKYIRRLIKEVQSIKDKLDSAISLSTQINEKNSEIIRNRDVEINKLKSEVQRLNLELQLAQAQFNKISKKNKRIDGDKTQIQIQTLTRQLKVANDENSRLLSRLNSSDAQVRNLTSQLEDLQTRRAKLELEAKTQPAPALKELDILGLTVLKQIYKI